jgi:hypothetical protein
MKRKMWYRYVLNIWTPVIIMAAINLHRWVWWNFYSQPDSAAFGTIRSICPKQGNFDVLEQRHCSDRGCIERVVLRREGIDTVIFSYEPDAATSSAVWLGPNELEIRLDHVSHIYSQMTFACDIGIKYRIGKVDDP